MTYPKHQKDEDFDTYIWSGFGPKVRAALAAQNRPDLEDAVKQRLRDFPVAWTTESIVDYLIDMAVSADIDLSDARSPAPA